MERSPTSKGYIRYQSVDLVLILLLVGVAVTGALALAAALAAGGSDRTRAGSVAERAAIWQAGYSARELRLFAGLAALARADLSAGQIEVVLRREEEGIVVTGSRLPPGRLGQAVPLGEGLAGRALVGGKTLVGLGSGEPGPHDGLVAIAVPIADAGVIVATAESGERLFSALDVERLEGLVARAAAALDVGAADIRDIG
jgi:hypothetical protein